MLSIVSSETYLEINYLTTLSYFECKNRFVSSYQNPVSGYVNVCAFVDALR